MTNSYRLLAMLAALTAAGCSGKKSEAPATAEAPAPGPEIEPLFGAGDPVSIDDATARGLPADTAGALTIADLPGLITRLGLGDDKDLVGALRDQLRDSLGIDLLDPSAARAAGLQVDRPITLAWLDPDARHLALAVAVADAAKLEESLAGRPLLIRDDRALIPLGSTAAATRARLDAVEPGHSLADSGVLDAVPALAVRGEVVLVFNPRAYPALDPATGVAVALRLDADAVPTAVAARFGPAGPPESRAWLGAALAQLGATLDVPLPTDRVALPLRTFLGRAPITAGFDAPLGVLALSRGGDDATLTYYGAELSGGKAVIAAAAAIAGAHAEREQEAVRVAAREQALLEAARAGVLQGQIMAQEGAFASITGTGDFSSGLDDKDIYGGLLGDEIGEMQGGFGFGSSDPGFGPGGGGDGWGTIGTGRYGSIGHGSGTGSGYGVGSGRGGLRGRAAAAPQVRLGNATVTGDLDKNIIRRYVRRKLPQVKYCYEKQLLVDPTLKGTVKVSFIISHTGQTGSVTAAGVHESVSSCIASAIEGIEFPKPKDGGIVRVEYPFTFAPAKK